MKCLCAFVYPYILLMDFEIRQSFWKTTLEENGIMPYEIYKVNFKNKNNQKENK